MSLINVTWQRNFLAFLNRDYQRVAELHVESGLGPTGTRVDEFEFAIRTVCEPLFDRSLREISFGTMLLRLFQTAQRFNMVILPQLGFAPENPGEYRRTRPAVVPRFGSLAYCQAHHGAMDEKSHGVRGLLKGTKDSVPHWLDRLPQLPGKTWI